MKSQYSNLDNLTNQLIASSERLANKANQNWRDQWTRERKEVRAITVDGKEAVLIS